MDQTGLKRLAQQSRDECYQQTLYRGGERAMHDGPLLIQYQSCDIIFTPWPNRWGDVISFSATITGWLLVFSMPDKPPHPTPPTQIFQQHSWKRVFTLCMGDALCLFLLCVCVCVCDSQKKKSELSWRGTVWPPGEYNAVSQRAFSSVCYISCGLPSQVASSSLQSHPWLTHTRMHIHTHKGTTYTVTQSMPQNPHTASLCTHTHTHTMQQCISSVFNHKYIHEIWLKFCWYFTMLPNLFGTNIFTSLMTSPGN